MASFTKYTLSQKNQTDLLRCSLMREVDRVIAFSESISENRAKAVWWLSQPLAMFAGKTALELITEGRNGDVIGYPQSSESGYGG